MENLKSGPLQFTGERVVQGKAPDHLWDDHVNRYRFASKYVEDKRVLDIACGSGYGSHILETQGKAKKVIGVDLSAEAVTHAKNEHKETSIDFLRGTIVNIPFPQAQFDIVVSFETIEHVKNCEGTLAEISRVLRPGGMLIISTPNRKLSSPGKSISDRPDNPFHLIEYTKDEFTLLLSDYFEVIQIYGQRKLTKYFTLPFINKIIRLSLPSLLGSRAGNSTIYKDSFFYIFRYTIAICKK